MKLKIYLFRHGQTYYNRPDKKRFTGHKNSKLTPKGIKQAKTIARKLKNKKFQIAYYTKLTRSRQTLKDVLKYHPECKKKIQDNRMMERSYGKLDGKFRSTIIKKYGKEQYDKWHRGFNIRPPGGESFADVEKRVRPFIRDLKKMMKKKKVNVAISAHGNSIRLFRKIMEKASIGKTVKWSVPQDDFYKYTVEA